MNRFRPLVALAALLALATALASCGGGSEGPQEVIDSATLEGIESGRVDLTLNAKAPGKEGGAIDVKVSGPFQEEGEGEAPQLDIEATAKGNLSGSKVDFDGGLVLLPNTAYVAYDGVTYEVDPTTYSFVEGTLKEQQREAGGEDEAVACQEAFGEIELGELVEEASSESNAEVGGTSTTKVSGTLDVPAALNALVELSEDPACASQLAAAGEQLPSKAEIDEAKDEIGEGVKKAEVEVYVGDDDIVRRIVARLKVEPGDDGEGPSQMDVDFDLKLTEVNEEQQISAPRGNVKPLSDLFIKLGVNPLELLGVLQGETSQGLDELLEGLEKSGAGVEGLGELFEGLGGTAR